ncbi:hypothetical protein HPC49_10155 [Pyxidicoccus fallax]|uniref:Lipoprotein n=1 Tax=Pyxidicoccus fallax TaxID=394095 RepID=A0A848LK23_9BACT|nr:hypothetical protein [Pyxidicoccus fallax]NMO18046.1 hypothetical protein [Pyxidicoccus fallax]NPC78604.1 hypothetical protein [Pyxidicoccus fallax]
MAPVLIVMALSGCALTAHAAGAETTFPKSPNRFIPRIARQYDALEFEAAIEMLPRAERFTSNTDRERLWLDLMKGVLHYRLSQGKPNGPQSEDARIAEAAFRRALERAPDAILPIRNPSQTLTQYFEELRAAYRQQLPVQQTASPEEPPPPPANISKEDLAKKLRKMESAAYEWAGGRLPPPVSAAFRDLYDQALVANSPKEKQTVAGEIDTWMRVLTDKDTRGVNSLTPTPVAPQPVHARSNHLSDEVPRSTFDLMLKSLTVYVLTQRVRGMKQWLIIQSEEGYSRQLVDLLNRVSEQHLELETAETSHERMGIAITLDRIEGQMFIHTGWRIRGSDPRPISFASR